MAVVAAATQSAAGATLIQLRAPGATAAQLVKDARTLVSGGVPVVVSSRADVALAVGAAGVQLPENDIPVAAARRLLGPGALVGRSVHTAAAAVEAERDGADYVVFGPVWETPTHPDREGAGVAALADVCAAVGIPVLAIGGVVEPDRVAAVLAAGAAGHASIRGFGG